MLAQAYKIYQLSCMRNAAAYYGLDAGVPTIVFGIYSLTKRQVNDSGYYKISRLFGS